MPIPLGVLAVAGAGAGPSAGAAYELLESVILTGTQATISFSNLNSTYGSTYQHLQVRYVARTNRGATNDPLRFTFNGDSGSNYSNHALTGTGSSVTSDETSTSQPYIVLNQGIAGDTATSNLFTSGIIDILDPFETTKNKTVRALFAGIQTSTAYRISLASGAYLNTPALTSILFDPIGDFVSGTRFSLYGMRSA